MAMAEKQRGSGATVKLIDVRTPAGPLWQKVGAGLAAFVGCGLVFAGITDTCGMGMLIARMPWN
jgi:hypothetical protein